MTTDTNDYRIWGFEPGFHRGLKRSAEELFTELDDQLEVRTLLVAFAVDGVRDPVVYLEPWPRLFPYELSILGDVSQKAEQNIQEDPRQDLRFGGSKQVRERRYESNRRQIKEEGWYTALRSVLEQQDDEWRTFVSLPEKIEGYRVMCVLQVQQDRLVDVPSLEITEVSAGIGETLDVETSLISAVATELMNAAKQGLRRVEVGRKSQAIRRSSAEILKLAGQRLMRKRLHVVFDGLIPAGTKNLFNIFNQLSTAHYEGEVLNGEIVLAQRGHRDVNAEVSFSEEVELSDAKAARKILEMTGNTEELRALSDGQVIYGLGHSSEYTGGDEDLYGISFTGPNAWKFRHYNNVLMEVRYGHPSLPRTEFDAQLSDLRQAIESEFGEETNKRRIETLAEAASGQEHGTAIVFHENAENEAKRLSAQGTPITPFEPDQEQIYSLSAIDGALLFDPTGTCHAIGVILDGKAAESRGTRSRGARYNSVLRYVRTSRDNDYSCVGVVISEDGPVDIFPSIDQGPDRSEILARIRRLEHLVDEPPARQLDRRTSSYPLMNWLVEHEEHLSVSEAEKVNMLQSKLHELLEASEYTLKRSWPNLKGNPAISDDDIS